MVRETCSVIERHRQYEHAGRVRGLVDGLTDADLMSRATAVLTPHAGAIRSKDVDSLNAAFPDYELRSLSDTLPAEVRDKIWADLGMLTMLVSTVSLVPPEMLTQIESFASAMASGMQQGVGQDLGASLGALFGGAPGGVNDNTTRNARDRTARSRGRRAPAAPSTAIRLQRPR